MSLSADARDDREGSHSPKRLCSVGNSDRGFPPELSPTGRGRGWAKRVGRSKLLFLGMHYTTKKFRMRESAPVGLLCKNIDRCPLLYKSKVSFSLTF